VKVHEGQAEMQRAGIGGGGNKEDRGQCGGGGKQREGPEKAARQWWRG
jgi:hypothetical protein